jgi:PST family polysaccharide transporter
VSTDRGRREEPLSEAASRSTIGERTLEGVRWISATRLAAEVLAFGSAVALAHLIPPAAFGRAAVALVLGAFAAAPFFRGFGSPLVQRSTVTREDLETAFALALAAGALLTALAALLGPLAFEPLFGQEISDLLRLASPVFVLAAVGVVPQALILRRLDFRATSIAEIAGVVTGVAVTLGLALAGAGAESLVVGALAALAASSTVMFAFARVPLPRWRPGRASALVSFGSAAGLASLFNATRANVDYLILGAKLAPAQVGFYSRAYTMGMDYQSKLTGVMMQMAFPIYSRSASVEEMRARRLRIARLHAAVLLPLLTLFIVVAPELVPWALGSRWEPAVVPAQILAVGGMAAAASSGTGSVVLAMGRPWLMVVFNGTLLAVLATVVFVTVPSGITAVAIGVAAVQVGGLVAAYQLLLAPVMGIRARRLWGDLLPGAVSSLALLAIALPLGQLADAGSFPAPVEVCVIAAAGGLASLTALRTLFPAAMADVALVARHVVRGDREPREPIPRPRVANA